MTYPDDDDGGCGCIVVIILIMILFVLFGTEILKKAKKEDPIKQSVEQPIKAEQEPTPEPTKQNSPKIPKEAQLIFVDNQYKKVLNGDFLIFNQIRYYQYPEQNKLTIYKEEKYKSIQNELITTEIHIYEFPNATQPTIQYLELITDKSEE